MLILVGRGPPVLTVKFAVAMWVSENIGGGSILLVIRNY